MQTVVEYVIIFSAQKLMFLLDILTFARKTVMGNCCGKESKGKPASNDKKFSDLQQADNNANAGNGHRNGNTKLSRAPSDVKESVSSGQVHIQTDITETEELEDDDSELQQEQQNEEQPNGEAGDSNEASAEEFGEKGDDQGEFKMAKAVAVYLYGDIAVIEHVLERVYLFGKDGIYKQTIATSNDEHREAKLKYPTDVVFTPLGHIAVTDQTKYVKIFNMDGDLVQRVNIKGKDDNTEVKPKAYSLDVFDQQILIGDIKRKCIVVVKEGEDGKSELIRKINLDIEPHFLATNVANGRQQAIICDWKVGAVNAIDLAIDHSEDNLIFKMDSFSIGGKPALPKGVACDDHHNIYVAMSRFDDSEKKNVYYDTGHVHKYSSDGQFQECIKKGLLHPRGLTWHNGLLYIANTQSVIVQKVKGSS